MEILTALKDIWLHENNHTGAIPAEIGNLTSLTGLLLNGNSFSSVESGALQPPAAVSIKINQNGMSQSAVDDALFDVYSGSLTRTASGGTFKIDGNNSAPSGTHQAAASCPVDGDTPGKEVAHELANDGCAEGFNVWTTVTFTA